MREIQVQKLTKDNFGKYGEFLDLLDESELKKKSIFQEGFFADVVALEFNQGNQPTISVCHVKKQSDNIISFLEAHQYACEGLLPLDGDVIIFAGIMDRDFRTESIEAFYVPKENLKNAVLNHPDVVAFKTAFQNAFGDFDAYLKSALIDGMTQLNAAGEEERLSREIFARLAEIPLVDRYAAYQLLDDDWKKIAIDLEIIQTEGFAATKQVDPNMVLKKDAEVQDGRVGHVLPFELVQSVKMHEEVAALRAKETRLAEIAGEYESYLDELSEEDKEQNFVNDAKDAFVAAEVKKAIKAREVEPATLSILKDVDALFAEEKTLKKKVKDDSAALHQRTKSVIEHLTDEEVCDLLHRKWILPLMENLNSLPDAVLDDFVKQLDAVCKKYETTFEDVESQIASTEHELLGLLDDLQGNEFDMQGITELKKLLGGE